MNSADDPMKQIWESYLTTRDCLKVALRSIEKGELHLMSKTKFVESTVDGTKKMIDGTKEMIQESQTHAGDFVVVSLWAVFERKIIEYLQTEGRKILQEIPSDFNVELHKKIENEIEYWRTSDILDLFKTVVNAELIGNAKQVKQYRDWIAHRNPKKGRPTIVTPQAAYKILSDIIKKIDQHPDLISSNP